MNRVDPHEAVRSRALVVAKDGQGGTVCVGRVIAYSVAPTFTVERADGSRIEWRSDMVEPAFCDTTPATMHERNLRLLKHEAETPMRGHDPHGRCCMYAAMGIEGDRLAYYVARDEAQGAALDESLKPWTGVGQ